MIKVRYEEGQHRPHVVCDECGRDCCATDNTSWVLFNDEITVFTCSPQCYSKAEPTLEMSFHQPLDAFLIYLQRNAGLLTKKAIKDAESSANLMARH